MIPKLEREPFPFSISPRHRPTRNVRMKKVRVIPSGKSSPVKFAGPRMETFERIINSLRAGVPALKLACKSTAKVLDLDRTRMCLTDLERNTFRMKFIRGMTFFFALASSTP